MDKTKQEAYTEYPMIQQNIIDSLYQYAEEGRPTGGFLRAVLENNLMEAFGRADEKNRVVLEYIIQVVYWTLPSPCWGNPEKVNQWIEQGGLNNKTQKVKR